MPSFRRTLNFFNNDYNRTLFPLKTNKIVINNYTSSIGKYIQEKIIKGDHNFTPQNRAYAIKYGQHLRRTVKLDPVAEFFIYDLVARNRHRFRKDYKANRINFGYRFEHGSMIRPRESYKAFKTHIFKARNNFSFGAKFDISSYFNSIYHHDLISWFDTISNQKEDVQALGRFLRQTNSGRSVDCLPHGIAPCKILGSHFLKFIDNSSRLQCDLMIRFMDDFYIFSDELEIIYRDFNKIQRLLGEKGLSINPIKTKVGDVTSVNLKKEIDDIKKSLLEIRRVIIETYEGYEEEEEEEVIIEGDLNAEQVHYLFNLLEDENIEEQDAELVLTLLRDHSSKVIDHISLFLNKFPSLTKKLYWFTQSIQDTNSFARLISDFINSQRHIPEYQLFWLGAIVEKYLLNTDYAGDLLLSLYEHRDATPISKAKILEIPESRFGMADLREEHLRVGKSDWLAWASAVGSRSDPKMKRNHLLTYFSNVSPMNKIIGGCVRDIL